MSDTKKREGWLPPRTGGYVPTRKKITRTVIVAGHKTAPEGGGGVGNIHLKKRDEAPA